MQPISKKRKNIGIALATLGIVATVLIGKGEFKTTKPLPDAPARLKYFAADRIAHEARLPLSKSQEGR